jgi:hypothetical protein
MARPTAVVQIKKLDEDAQVALDNAANLDVQQTVSTGRIQADLQVLTTDWRLLLACRDTNHTALDDGS